MHPYTRMEDNTALNAIRLICSDDSEVGTAEGRLGAWTAEVRCQNDGDYITAVKIKTEEWLGWGAEQNYGYNKNRFCSKTCGVDENSDKSHSAKNILILQTLHDNLGTKRSHPKGNPYGTEVKQKRNWSSCGSHSKVNL